LTNALRRKDAIFAQYPVDGAAQRCVHLGFARLAAEPVLEEAADHPLADDQLSDSSTDGFDYASAIGDWHQRKLLA
jgi:hypothetical protein